MYPDLDFSSLLAEDQGDFPMDDESHDESSYENDDEPPNEIDERPRLVMTEKKIDFPDRDIAGCLFHLVQNMKKKLREFGLIHRANSSLSRSSPRWSHAFIPNVFYNALSTLTLPDLGILLRNLMGFTTLPNFLNTIQTQSPALFGALNGINGAYGNSFYPMLTSMAQNPAFQTFAQQVTAGGVQPPLTQPQPQGAIPQQQSQPMPQPPIPNLVQSLPQQPQPVPAPQQPQPALAPQPQQPAPQPAGGGLGNLLQPIIEETEQIIDSTEDVIEETGGMNNGQAPQQGMLQGAPQAPVPPAGK